MFTIRGGGDEIFIGPVQFCLVFPRNYPGLPRFFQVRDRSREEGEVPKSPSGHASAIFFPDVTFPEMVAHQELL